MALYKFGQNDIFHNRIKTHPSVEFHIYDSIVYYNNRSLEAGNFVSSVPNAQPGELSLYELNVDRVSGSTTKPDIIYTFIEKGNDLSSFKTVSTSDFAQNYSYGDVVSKDYPFTASIHRSCFTASAPRPRITSLKNTMNYYTPLSNHYSFSSSMGDKESQAVSLISIPSIFYGSSIKKGTVNLEFYHSASLIARAQDIGKNGSLVDTFTGSAATGSVVGFVLYNEGFIFLTSSVVINAEVNDNYQGGATTPAWIYFADYGDSRIPYTGATYSMCSSSYIMEFSGTTYTPVITMFANAPKNAVNVSTNKTILNYNSASLSGAFTGSSGYEEPSIPIVNLVSSSFNKTSAPFEKTVYISEICLYDDEYNRIGIAKLAKPIEKKTSNDLTFKLKLDI